MVEWHNAALGNVDEFLINNDKLAWHIARKFENTGRNHGITLDDLHSLAQFGMLKSYQSFKPDFGVKWQTFAGRAMHNEILLALRKARRAPQTVSLEYSLSVDEQGNELTFADVVCGERDIDISEPWFYEYAVCLSERDRTIIHRRIRGDKQYEIATELGVSQSYISRLITRIEREYEKGEWKMTRTIGGDLERAKELIQTTNWDNLTISNETGVAVNRVRVLRHESMDNKQASTPVVQAPTTIIHTELSSSIDRKEPAKTVNLLTRIATLRQKFTECMDELAEIEKEVVPVINAKTEMSEMAKKLLELVS